MNCTNKHTEVRRYEDATTLFTTVDIGRGTLSPIWRCIHCDSLHGVCIDGVAERLARECCANDFPCYKDGCDGRTRFAHNACEPCRATATRKRNEKVEVGEWDSEDIFVDDEYVTCLYDYLHDLDELPDPHDLALVCRIPEPGKWPQFSLCDYVSENIDFDLFGHDYDLPKSFIELDARISECLATESTGWVEAGDKRPATEVIAKIVAECRAEREREASGQR